jgi:hypothetical protein
VVSANWACKQPIAFEVQKNSLEQMGKVKDAIAAALEHLDLVGQPFDKATVVPMPEVIEACA